MKECFEIIITIIFSNSFIGLRSEVLTPVATKITVIWDVTRCSLIEVY
jgi:hypothetical protein